MRHACSRIIDSIKGRNIARPASQRSDKRERQYEHIKSGLRQRGKNEAVAEEIAARTVNKVRAQKGKSDNASKTSTEDTSPSGRRGLHSHRRTAGRTYKQLYAEAQTKNIEGRSKMSKAQLEKSLSR